MDTVQIVPEEDESLIYLAGGGLAAIFLGMALVPLREFTVASNFTFPFMALTIAVAEFGGRRAAVVTALISALSLDFFLTQPYLRLTIAGKHDLIAFLGLATCGLVAAAFGSGRRRKTAALRAASNHLLLLRFALRQVDEAEPLGQTLARILDEAHTALPLSALVLRDERGQILAACGGGEQKAAPRQELRPDTLLPDDPTVRNQPRVRQPPIPQITTRVLARGGVPLPEEGARLPLTRGNRRVGWLDLWGDSRPAGFEARRTLSDLGRLLSVWVSAGGGAPGRA